MLQIKNNTPFSAEISLLPNEQGIDTLYIITKATFKIGDKWTLTDKQPPPTKADEFWGEPDSSSIKIPSDYHLGKVSTDIIMIGNAFSPNGQPVTQLDVNLRVSQCEKTIRVFGDRQWNNGVISHAAPFQSMPMVYERAYGGVHQSENGFDSEKCNPVGLGFVGKRNRSELNGFPLPNLEDPLHLISSQRDTPKPVCFGANAGHWNPRASYAGTYDDNWLTTRAPYLPVDFDKRFFNVAMPELIFPQFLVGGEEVEISNMHTKGNLKFSLPFISFTAQVDIAGEVKKPTFNLETLILAPNDLTITMVWRAAVNCNKKVSKIVDVKLNLTR